MPDLPLLPSDRYIADLLGLTEDQYRFYQAEVRRRAAAQPRPAVVNLPATLATISLIATLISVGLTIAASFFKPKAQQPPRLQQNQTQGQSISDVRRFVPRNGFDSVQDVARIGDFIPLIYAKRELIDGQYYGGVRINVPLIWSQIQALDKAQLLRAMFLIGEGDPNLQIDPANIAIGNNTLGSYLLGNTENARFTVYYRPNGGRITAGDRLIGTSNDPGSLLPEDVYAITNGTASLPLAEDDPDGYATYFGSSWRLGPNRAHITADTDPFYVTPPDEAVDFYMQEGSAVQVVDGLAPDFCHAHRPTTQTQFGVYSLIGNGLGLRVNPTLRPGVNAQVTVKVNGSKKNTKAEGRVVCEPDYVSLAQRKKFRAYFSGRSGLIQQNGNTWTYHLSNTTDAETTFSAGPDVTAWNTRIEVATNPFQDISAATVQSWLSVGAVLATSNQLSAVATLNTAAVETALATEDDGTYVIDYSVFFERGSKEIYTEHMVSISKTTEIDLNTLQIVSSYTYTNASATLIVPVNERLDVHQERAGDIAAAVAGRQKSWDDALQVGELIKMGSALAIVTNRSPSTLGFNSDADFEPPSPSQGNAIDVTLEVIRPGSAEVIPLVDLRRDADNNPPFKTATNFPHLFRVAIATFATLRECRIVEICIRSSLGIRISGLCNFRDTLTYNEIDGRACYDKEDNPIAPGDYLTVDIFNSGQMNSSEERYSFFRLRYREAGTQGPFIDLAPCLGVRGITQQAIFNDFRVIMPSIKRWEFQIEPLSGWEIRSGTATGDLELIDSSLSTQRTVTVGEVTLQFRGAVSEAGPFIPAASRTTEGNSRFQLTSVQRGGRGEIGIGYADGNSYLDRWGKLAEAFVYEEVRTSAEGGPEHEVVNINEIIPNPVAPLYDRLAVLGFNVRSGPEFQQFGQLSVYVTQGLQSTHLFPEVLLDVMTNPEYGRGDLITLEQIDVESFEAAATWCHERRLFFDGGAVGRVNIRQWAADVGAAHLLLFGESGGRFWLRPAWPGTVARPEPVEIKGIFTAGFIQEGTFSLQGFEPEDRRPIQVSVRYREERLSTSLDNPGLFPVEREVLVREASPFASETDPIESLDLSDYCTSRQHAIDAGKFVARMRRIPDHAIRFSTTHEALVAPLAPGDFIRVVMDISYTQELRNGAVLGNGALVSTQPLEDGTYSVMAWDGSSNTEPAITTLSVSAGGSRATPTGVIFTLVNSATQTFTYQIEKISPPEDGGYSIEAVHMPTNDNGILQLADGFDDETNWIILD